MAKKFMPVVAVLILVALLLSTFPLQLAEASPSWWNPDWQYKRKLTIAASDVGSDLSDFPVLVHLSSSCGKGNSDLSGLFDGKTQDNGQDIRFVNAAEDTVLSYEIEKWDNSGKEAWIWVNIPVVSSSSDTHFYMYYGNPGASDGQNPTAVWGKHFKMVQHLEESSGNLLDSTSYDNDGVNYGAVYEDSGEINGCYAFTDADRIQIERSSSLTITQNITLEAFVYLNDKTDGKIIAKDDTAGGGCYCLQQENGNLELMLDLRGWVHLSYGTYNTGEWVYLVGTYDRAMMRLYLNGVELATKSQTNVIRNRPINLALGNRADDNGTNYDLHGLIDEARISDTARPADWIKAQYLSMTDAFVTYGEEELPQLEADFSAEPREGAPPLVVQFTDESESDIIITSWLWEFGDGGTSSEQHPTYTYTNPGTYTVSLTVNTAVGTDTETKEDYITVYQAVVADFSAEPREGVAPIEVQFTDESTGEYDSWSWDFGDGDTSDEQNPSHTYYTEGLYRVSLTVTGPGGQTPRPRKGISP